MDPLDFPLSKGAGYFVNEDDVKRYEADLGDFKPEVRGCPTVVAHLIDGVLKHSTCHKFGAMGYAGYGGAVSGTIGVSCARHMFILPSSGVDLKKGERYAVVPRSLVSD